MVPNLAAAKVECHPFPYAVVDALFSEVDFADLATSYPQCPPASGPTGHTIHRGDPQFDSIMANHAPWREFFTRCNSQSFLDSVTALFADEIAASCALKASELRHVDHVESRDEKEALRIADPTLPPEAIFVRFDFMQGMTSYVRRPHLDHRRRLATALIYFDAPSPETFKGGDLILHDPLGRAARRIPPARNRAVLFPCSERSWHSVEALTDCRQPRRFVQIALSSCHDVWPTAQLPQSGVMGRGRAIMRRLLG